MKFDQAHKIRTRIKQLYLLETEKINHEIKLKHEFDLNQLKTERDETIKDFNDKYDILYNNLKDKFQEALAGMTEEHQIEYEAAIKEFNENFPENNPKLTPEVLHLYRRLQILVKKKE